MTVEKYEAAGKIISRMDDYLDEIDKIEKANRQLNPYGYLEVKTGTMEPVRIKLSVEMTKRCIWLVNDMYQEKYQATQKELEAL